VNKESQYQQYQQFIEHKIHLTENFGFTPTWIPDILFDFQKFLIEWACQKGRAALFEDCGMGKTFQYLTIAENIVRRTNKRVLILTPLAVSFQTVLEGEKLGVEVTRRRTGINSSDKIVVTNYERLHYFNSQDFICTICDESSILKNYDGEYRKVITDFMKKHPYRFLCTATAAPNDWPEIGTSSEALGYLGFTDMLAKFFKKTKKGRSRRDELKAGMYRFRGHAEENFWRWVCSWARAIRKPSDMGFDDDGFVLPELIRQQHIVKASALPDGFLFEVPAVGQQEQRNELKRTIVQRCEKAAELINAHDRHAVAWCYLIEEGHRLEKLIQGSINVEGADPEEKKEEAFKAFIKGELRVMISKPTIAGFGLNWQHCAHMTFFPSHSYEQFYQGVRRMWRFGQKRSVTVDVISTEGQKRVLNNLQRKSVAADKMFTMLTTMMKHELNIHHTNMYTQEEVIPSWL